MSTTERSESNLPSNDTDVTPDLVDDSVLNASGDVPPIDTVTDLLNVQCWLDRQQYDYNIQIAAADHSEQTEDLEKLQESLAVLQDDLVTETSKASLRDLTIKRLQLGQTLKNILYPSDVDVSVYRTDSAKKECIELLKMQQQLVSETIEKSKVVQELNESLGTLKKANFDMKVENRKLMASIDEQHSSMQAQADLFSKNKNGQKMKSHLQNLVNKIVIERQVLKGVILGSGVNWQQDPVMREKLNSLGEPLDI